MVDDSLIVEEKHTTDIYFDPDYGDLDFWFKKCDGFGINPQETLEKGYDGS